MNGEADPTPDVAEARLASLPGVKQVDLSDYPESISLRCDPSQLTALAAESLRQQVRAASGVDAEIRIELERSGPESVERRSRFESIMLDYPSPGWIEARTTLEWDGSTFSGEAEGESSPGGELRVCASSALRAVEAVAGGKVDFALIGVKEIHVFDHDFVVVLLQYTEREVRRLIGTAIIGEDRRKAAALAALNATNRVLGKVVVATP